MSSLKIAGVKDFIIPEFVPEEIWRIYGGHSIKFLSMFLMPTSQKIRDRFGRPMTVNTWYFNNGKGTQWCGFRTPECEVGSRLSRHRLGLCIDTQVEGITPQELQKDIVDHYEDFYKDIGVTAMEADTESWTHISGEQTLFEELLIIPNRHVQAS